MRDLLEALGGVRPAGKGWTARCPAHEDRRSSLSIGRGKDDRWLLKCHAGCELDDILAAAHLELADLFPANTARTKTNGHTPGHREIVATYDYRDETGTMLFQVCRCLPKTFRHRRPDGAGRWIWNNTGVRRVPYQLDKLKQTPTVFITEGEKDADRLWSLGLPATTNPAGAGKWRAEYSALLKAAGCRAVIVLPDNDAPGEAHGRAVAQSCIEAGLDVKLVQLPGVPDKGDVSDYLQHHSPDDLRMLVRDAPLFHAEPRPDEDEDQRIYCPTCGLESCENEDHFPNQPAPDGRPVEDHDDRDDRAIETEYRRERARRVVRVRLDREARGPIQIPEFITLRMALTRPQPGLLWRIEGWQPQHSNIMLTAQYKGGKTSLIGNLLRSLVDGDDFLGQHATTPIAGTVVLIDTEMPQHTLEAWLAAQRIAADDRVVPLALKGSLATFNPLDDENRAAWAARFLEHQCAYLVVDNLRPVLDVHGLDEQHDAGRVLVALDGLLRDARIPESCLVHHMGHVGERARGDSRLRDWPDVEWRIVRQDENPASARYISAYGRDVEIPESQLIYDRTTRRLTVVEGTRKEALLRDDLGRVRQILNGQLEAPSGSQIKRLLTGRVPAKRVDAALRHGLDTEVLDAFPGPKRATLYRVNGSVSSVS